MEARASGAGWDTQGTGHRLKRHIEVLVHHHHRSMLERESLEAALQLVAIGHAAYIVDSHRLPADDAEHLRHAALALAGFGFALVGLTAWLERRARAAKVSHPVAPGLPQ